MSETRIIPIVTKKFGSLEAMVDANKYDLAMSVDTSWGVCWNKRTFYVRRNLIGPQQRYKGEKQLLHHLVLGSPPQGMVVDFINHNGLDCRVQNLRFASPKDDQGNRRKVYSSTAPYKGVTYRGQQFPASPLTFLYGLCRKALSVPFDDPLSVLDATGVANIDAIRGCKPFLVPV